ncbi:MAG: polyamine aminopropyltransferase [Chitinispirillales bacterium]|jgi:spermidine synthase|nr:polyamine aminopropyltransferase [Chitinispirillales bacterium]
MARIIKRRRLYQEALNPAFGYFYTIKKTLRKASTKYQKIELVDTDEFGKTLLIDDITQVAEKNEFMYHEPMVHPALCGHPRPESVLIVGGGDGGITREVLKYPTVRRVELAELDGGVVSFAKKYLGGIHGGCFDDRRVNVNITDGRKFAEDHPGEFDVVIMDMTDPFGPSCMLYTREFYRLARRAMRDRAGIYAMHSESPVSRPDAFACICKTLSAVFKHVNPMYMYIQMYAVLWSMAMASDKIDLNAVKPAAIDRKLARLGIKGLKMYNGATHAAMLTPYPYIQDVLRKPARIITDAKPEFPDNFLH